MKTLKIHRDAHVAIGYLDDDPRPFFYIGPGENDEAWVVPLDAIATRVKLGEVKLVDPDEGSCEVQFERDDTQPELRCPACAHSPKHAMNILSSFKQQCSHCKGIFWSREFRRPEVIRHD